MSSTDKISRSSFKKITKNKKGKRKRERSVSFKLPPTAEEEDPAELAEIKAWKEKLERTRKELIAKKKKEDSKLILPKLSAKARKRLSKDDLIRRNLTESFYECLRKRKRDEEESKFVGGMYDVLDVSPNPYPEGWQKRVKEVAKIQDIQKGMKLNDKWQTTQYYKKKQQNRKNNSPKMSPEQKSKQEPKENQKNSKKVLQRISPKVSKRQQESKMSPVQKSKQGPKENQKNSKKVLQRISPKVSKKKQEPKENQIKLKQKNSKKVLLRISPKVSKKLNQKNNKKVLQKISPKVPKKQQEPKENQTKNRRSKKLNKSAKPKATKQKIEKEMEEKQPKLKKQNSKKLRKNQKNLKCAATLETQINCERKSEHDEKIIQAKINKLEKLRNIARKEFECVRKKIERSEKFEEKVNKRKLILRKKEKRIYRKKQKEEYIYGHREIRDHTIDFINAYKTLMEQRTDKRSNMVGFLSSRFRKYTLLHELQMALINKNRVPENIEPGQEVKARNKKRAATMPTPATPGCSLLPKINRRKEFKKIYKFDKEKLLFLFKLDELKANREAGFYNRRAKFAQKQLEDGLKKIEEEEINLKKQKTKFNSKILLWSYKHLDEYPYWHDDETQDVRDFLHKKERDEVIKKQKQQNKDREWKIYKEKMYATKNKNNSIQNCTNNSKLIPNQNNRGAIKQVSGFVRK